MDGAHPRSRGEHGRTIPHRVQGEGSSPLARGTPVPATDGLTEGGLIPARAGNTLHNLYLVMVPWAHPRSRGEHVPAVRFKLTGPGSSPLARGTLVLFLPLGFPIGLIPARAGNTAGTLTRVAALGAHPRSRGEHRLVPYCMGLHLGSSPLARGTLQDHGPLV